MSLLELIAKHPTIGPGSLSLPDLLAEEALGQLSRGDSARVKSLMAECFVAELIHPDPGRAEAYVACLIEHGVTAARIVDHYIPAAADLLGRAWENDGLDFAAVTHASGQLMRLVREFSPQPSLAHFLRADQPRVMLARAPGEEHTLGLVLLAHQMRRRGWLVRLELSGDIASLTAAFTQQTFDFVGISAAHPDRAEGLATSVAVSRRALPGTPVAVGGYWAETESNLAAICGADISLGRRTEPIDVLVTEFSLKDM